jgi:hypothetical protein
MADGQNTSFIGAYRANERPLADFQILRNSIAVGTYRLYGGQVNPAAADEYIYVPGSSINMVDLPPGPGTYTYTLNISSLYTQALVYNCKIFAYEL